MDAYLAIKFYEDAKNRSLIEGITAALETAGFHALVFIRDVEHWGKKRFPPKELMTMAFALIDKSSFLVVEFSEKGVGLGIEAGFAFSKSKPIIVIAKRGSDISETMRGIAKEIFFYDDPSDLTACFRSLKL